MTSYHPIARCLMLLCLGTAALLVYLEWQDPFSLRAPGLGNRAAAANHRLADRADRLADAPFSWQRLWHRQPPIEAELPAQPSVEVRVSLTTRQVALYENGNLTKQFPAAIGQDDWQTPAGTFTVLDMQKNPAWEHPITGKVIATGPENPLGTHWIGFWQEDGTQIGFHGTNQADLIGQAVSHGCIRMHNADIAELYDYLQPGVPVVVAP